MKYIIYISLIIAVWQTTVIPKTVVSPKTTIIAGGVSTPAFVFIQGPTLHQSFSGTACTQSMGSNVTSGDLVFFAITESTTGITFTIANTGVTGTWNSITTYGSGSTSTQVWYLIATSTGAMTTTVTTSTGGVTTCGGAEFSGNTATPLDQSGTVGGTFTASPSVTTSGNLTVNNELGISWFDCNCGNFTGAAGTGYTLISTISNQAVFQYQILSGGSGATLTATAPLTSGSSTIDAGVFTFKP